jgi:hypothetical protein
LELYGRRPLFYTDFGKRWDRRDVYRMFIIYKDKANIQTGRLHVFARHTPATLMTANGCDIRIVKELLRHRDIRTTLRYAHVSDKILREKYNQCLTLDYQSKDDRLNSTARTTLRKLTRCQKIIPEHTNARRLETRKGRWLQ